MADIVGNVEQSAILLEKVTFNYPETMTQGDVVTVSLNTQQGKKLTLIDEEQATISTLPVENVNDFVGSTADVSIDQVDADGLSISLSATYEVLDSDYVLSVTINRVDGSLVETGPINVTTTCDANLVTSMSVGPFTITDVIANQTQPSNNLPAIVLNQYGEGRTVFMAYNIIDSYLNSGEQVHANILANSANYLLPERSGVEPDGIALIETTLTVNGADLNITAVDTLDVNLTHLPLFGLTQYPLSYSFSLSDGEQASYRYFIRYPNQMGDYFKRTDIFLELDGDSTLYDSFERVFTVPTDSNALF